MKENMMKSSKLINFLKNLKTDNKENHVNHLTLIVKFLDEHKGRFPETSSEIQSLPSCDVNNNDFGETSRGMLRCQGGALRHDMTRNTLCQMTKILEFQVRLPKNPGEHTVFFPETFSKSDDLS